MVSIKSDGLVREAKLYERERNFRACAQTMLQAAESLPQHARHAERLYDAGICFTKARLIGQAVAVRNQLIEQHPDDPLAERALHELANSYQQIAVYDRAASHFERFASRFPGEKEAAPALGSAYAFRVALGEHDRAIADMKEFIRLYGGHRPQEAADAFFQIGEIYERTNQDAEHVKHLEAYLRQWAAKGSIDKRMVAHFKLGEHLWRRSCPHEGQLGACLKIERASATGRQRAFYEINRRRIQDGRKQLKAEKSSPQCGPLTKSRITVLSRSAGQARMAQEHFASVLRLYAGGAVLRRVPAGKEQAAREALMRSTAAGALFYQGEQVYEEFLRIKFPEGLELQPPSPLHPARRAAALQKKYDREVKILSAYLTQKSRLADRLSGPSAAQKGIYDRVVELRVADWTIAASARLGQVWANFADQLYTAPIPKWLKEGDEWGRSPRDLYCIELENRAEPLERKARQGYELCLNAARERSVFDRWSHMCEAELSQILPAEYPVADEIRPQPGYAPRVMVPAGVIRELAPRSSDAVATEL